MPISFTVIIVTYRSADCIAACLSSLRVQQGVTLEVVVVDNASPDNTVEIVRAQTPKVHLVANHQNVGFGQANNQGAALAHGRWIHLLNPDAQFAQPNGLQLLGLAMSEHPRWGLAGTRLLSADGLEESKPSTDYPGQRHLTRPLPELPGKIAWVGGASLCIRREVYQALHGFDPGFFLYSEETDLCLRARKLDYEIGFAGNVEVRHVGGASEAGSHVEDRYRRRLAGLHRFWLKHYPLADVLRLLRREEVRAAVRAAYCRCLERLTLGSPTTAIQRRRYQTTATASSQLRRR